jgi:hypothetical protein
MEEIAQESQEEAVKYPRNGKRWDRQETRRALLLLANGYEIREVSDHMGRGEASIRLELKNMETSIDELRTIRKLSVVERLNLPSLPPFDPDAVFRPVEKDFPGMSFVPQVTGAPQATGLQFALPNKIPVPNVPQPAPEPQDRVYGGEHTDTVETKSGTFAALRNIQV